ncbi:MAG: enolase C-terminal domain-like protein [Candidatus Woykebacteria bacterium]
MARIENIKSEEIIDSRGVPTLKTSVFLQGGAIGETSVPSGTSTGAHEAYELRDRDPKHYSGLGVQKAVANIQGVILQSVRGLEASDQKRVDKSLIELDGTEKKMRLGANAMLSVSLANAVAQANNQQIPLYRHIRKNILNDPNKVFDLPLLMANVIEGGQHVTHGLDFQEFLVLPKGFRFFSEGYTNIKKLIDSLREKIKQKRLNHSLGMEGGFAAHLRKNTDAIELIEAAIDEVKLYKEGFGFGLDIAATNIFGKSGYQTQDFTQAVGKDEYLDFVEKISKKYKLYSIEDPVVDDDWDGWSRLTKHLSPETLVIGDDLTTTNTARLEIAISRKSVTGVVIKPNQIGTLSETLNFITVAKQAGLKTAVSHRSGETDDTFICDLAVAINADHIKIGSPLKKERKVKYDRLLEIEREIAGANY